MTYQAPIRDIMFNIEHLSAWPQVTSLPAYSDIDKMDAQAVLEGFGQFCSEFIVPLSVIGDSVGTHFDGKKVRMPEPFGQAYARFVEMGWQSMSHPVEQGGMGLPRVVSAAATEILNASDMSFGLCPLLTDSAIDALLRSGSDKQKKLYLEPLISGRWSGTMNLTEPQAGSDLGRVRCKAERRDDGCFTITGTKIFITYGEHDLSENIIHLVLARTLGAPDGPKGLSLFIVPKYLVEDDGSLNHRNSIECISIEHKLGIRASPTAVLGYNGATGFLVGEENHGLEYMFTMMTSARFSVGVQGVAVSERAYQHALAYAQGRLQGRPLDGTSNEAVPITQHPDVRRMLLRMSSLVEAGRALAMSTAGWLDLAHNSGDEPGHNASLMAEFLVPIVKGYCTERSLEVTSLNLQIHGGMGYIEETGVAQFYRDARILPIYEGTTAIQANDLLGRKVMRDDGYVAHRFSGLVKETEVLLRNGGPQALIIAERLSQARDAFDTSLEWLLKTAARDINSAFAGSVPFLAIAGNLAAGWQLGRSVLVAEARLKKGEDIEFMSKKIATACFYAQHILVECDTDRARIIDGGASLFDSSLQL